MSVLVPLSKPLKTHDGDVSVITLRDIEGKDIVAVRVPPVKFIEADGESHTEYRYDVVMQLAARLSGIDDILLGKLNGKDFHALSKAVLNIWNGSGE
jgi:hypothetical protein